MALPYLLSLFNFRAVKLKVLLERRKTSEFGGSIAIVSPAFNYISKTYLVDKVEKKTAIYSVLKIASAPAMELLHKVLTTSA